MGFNKQTLLKECSRLLHPYYWINIILCTSSSHFFTNSITTNLRFFSRYFISLLFDEVKINLPKLRFIKSLCHTAILKNLNLQEAKHDQEKISTEQKWKVCWQIPAMFCLLHIKPKFKFAVQCSWFLETYLIWATFTCKFHKVLSIKDVSNGEGSKIG